MTSIEHLVHQFLENGAIPAALEERLRIPADRLAIYRLIVDRDPRQFRQLLLRLFDEEISFREALWHGTAENDGEFGEGIYHCAFLIHCCGEPSDAATLWKAQYLNQDIGELEGFYFVGAGVTETLSYFQHTHDPTSTAIAEYIEDWSRHISRDSLAEWQQDRRQWIRDDADRSA
jgi:hypothetical protein